VRSLYVPDSLGSTVALLDNTQTQTDTFSYWPYSEVNTRTGTTPTPFQFGGIRHCTLVMHQHCEAICASFGGVKQCCETYEATISRPGEPPTLVITLHTCSCNGHGVVIPYQPSTGIAKAGRSIATGGTYA
jgi:hypothetical protein